MKRETEIQNGIRVGVSHGDVRVWRNNVGTAWYKSKKRGAKPRPVKFGLCKGSSDLIGYKTIEITKDMVGRRVAVFVALEVKTDVGEASSEQLRFLELINRAGGIARIIRTLDDARFWLEAGPPTLWSTQTQEGGGRADTPPRYRQDGPHWE